MSLAAFWRAEFRTRAVTPHRPSGLFRWTPCGLWVNACRGGPVSINLVLWTD